MQYIPIRVEISFTQTLAVYNTPRHVLLLLLIASRVVSYFYSYHVRTRCKAPAGSLYVCTRYHGYSTALLTCTRPVVRTLLCSLLSTEYGGNVRIYGAGTEHLAVHIFGRDVAMMLYMILHAHL